MGWGVLAGISARYHIPYRTTSPKDAHIAEDDEGVAVVSPE